MTQLIKYRGTTMSSMLILAYLVEHGETTVRELARIFDMSATGVFTAMAGFTAAGHVVKRECSVLSTSTRTRTDLSPTYNWTRKYSHFSATTSGYSLLSNFTLTMDKALQRKPR